MTDVLPVTQEGLAIRLAKLGAGRRDDAPARTVGRVGRANDPRTPRFVADRTRIPR
jgi:hypothetical protein